MNRRHASIPLLATLCALLIAASAACCGQAPSFDDRLNAVAKPYRFHILRWELGRLLGTSALPADRTERATKHENAIEQVPEYFALTDEIGRLETEIDAISTGDRTGDLSARQKDLENLQRSKSALRDGVERVLGRQVRLAFSRQGVFNPADRYARVGIAFPPIYFTLEPPPHLLVVSPRDRIESMREIMLLQDIDHETMDNLERSVDALGVSALVVPLGGFGGTYPAFVADDASLAYTIGTVAEEWFHQYLFFTPIGFRYALDAIGVARNYEIATMNETLAGIVREEITDMVMEIHYPPHGSPRVALASAQQQFDFNREMRELRLAVDELLANGEIEQAEALMEQCRQYLASRGYYIRKLNQAYFAFHGTYAAEPTSVDPIGVEMREVRRQSASLRDFVNRVATMRSRQDLIDSLEAHTQ